MFNTRIVFGTIAAAGLFAAAAATPAMAAAAGHPRNNHGSKPIAVTTPVTTVLNGGPLTGPVEGLTGGMPGGLGELLDGLFSSIDGLLRGFTLGGGGAMPGEPAMGTPLSGVTNAVPGLGQVTGTVSAALNGVVSGATGAVKKLPVVGNVANTAQGTLGGVTGTLGGITGTLSGLTGMVPGLGSLVSPPMGR